MTRRQMLTALFGAAVLALPVAGCGHQPVQDEPGAELILRYAENQPEDYPTTQAALAFAGSTLKIAFAVMSLPVAGMMKVATLTTSSATVYVTSFLSASLTSQPFSI